MRNPMIVRLSDAAMQRPPSRWNHSDVWHWLWARVFGRRMPTSGDRAHVGKLLVTLQPELSMEEFKAGKWFTDAARIHVIGDLWIFDYEKDPRRAQTLDSDFPMLGNHDNMGDDDAALLKENMRSFRTPTEYL